MDAASWSAPPEDVLGATVPIEQFVARTGRAVVALEHAAAFPEGCLLTLRLSVRRGPLDDAVWERVTAGHYELDTDGGLRLGVRFADGSRATTVEHPFPGWAAPTDRPERPMLVEAGGEASSDARRYRCRQWLWLWPLPPPAGFELVVEWRNAGIAETAAAVDGAAIARAAPHAAPFWP